MTDTKTDLATLVARQREFAGTREAFVEAQRNTKSELRAAGDRVDLGRWRSVRKVN